MFRHTGFLSGLFLLAAVVATGFYGCGGKTTAPFDFTIEASVTEGTAPLEVSFTTTVNSGKMPVIFTWNFGDGSDAVYDQNPTHIYETAGAFTATLDATDDAGKYLTKTIDITVRDPLSVVAAADPTEGIAPLLVNFSSSVTGGTEPYTYLWDFKDGATASTASTSHVFQVAGDFSVNLTVTDASGATGESEVVISVADDHTPVASITANPTVGVAPLDVTFQGSVVGGDPPFSFLWNFGDGETADTQDVLHTFQNPGTYTVVFLVTDDDGDSDDETIQRTPGRAVHGQRGRRQRTIHLRLGLQWRHDHRLHYPGSCLQFCRRGSHRHGNGDGL
jgi:PKD repeat protein